ncbi:TVP38/TMEM64 family protein [Commensalibacter papalotli (ex Servin-Garciduenas et al. 2014)]|uniref:TVP38/TMEM64 family membrane protein n=1 Tax=Commensalibacter papalotli (ex Servin-Garciduenas et al. 2014) TaxID=1208583 RepID=W7E6Z0_9PROT|nr:VTT domain-containing protein [Commensalibacter papalotli (ex Servin-Garciduenas et al. 2014)]EUK18916.1 DedA integral membrane protein [Commensalibacter papalotli (ex Servin-Garciduenas et al. 2014)]
MSQKTSKKSFCLFIFFLVAISIIGAWILISRNTDTLHQLIEFYQQRKQASTLKELIISEIIQVIIALCGVLPASTAAFGSGALYGILQGFILSAIATLIGAFISFYLSRSIFRSFIEKFLKRSSRMQKLDNLLHLDGWKLVCLLRISPIMPFALTSYALGLTSISVRAYLIGTLASLPALFGYVVMGHIASTEVTSLQTQHIASIKHLLLAIAFIGTGLLIWHLGKIVNKIIKLPDPN